MKESSVIAVAIMTIVIFMASAASAQGLDIKNSVGFKDHNFVITKFMVNGTVGTANALTFATVEEPLVIVAENQTIAVSLKEWGVDSSRSGVILAINNGTGPRSVEYLMPLQRGWGTQIGEVSFSSLKVQVGLMEAFRGKSAEYARFCVMVIKVPIK